MKFLELTICGLRSFGAEAQSIKLSGPLTIVRAVNTQGKTSIAESLEFLLAGRLSKPLLAGGAPGEYEDSLRNVHLPMAAEAYIEASIEFADGSIHVLRRELVSDYRRAQECQSVLTLDGAPLEAPILLQHSLRYVVSAKPSERTDFFKALLEVSDLDEIRSAIDSVLRERDATPKAKSIAKIEAMQSHASMRAGAMFLLAATDEGEARTRLHEMTAAAAVKAGLIESIEASVGLAATSGVLADEVTRRQGEVFPLIAFDLRQISSTVTVAGEDITTAGGEYERARESVDESVRRLLGLYEKLLELPECNPASHVAAIDCPICGTEKALTPERVRLIRDTVTADAELPAKAREASETFGELAKQLSRMKRQVEGSLPSSLKWSTEERAAKRADAMRLGARETQLDELEGAAREMQGRVGSIVAMIEGVSPKLAESLEAIARHGELNATTIAELVAALSALGSAAGEFNERASVYRGMASSTLSPVRAIVSRRSSTDDLQLLLDVVALSASVWTDIRTSRDIERATERLRTAGKEIDLASRQLVDNRFDGMSDEIARWWQLLRPSDHSEFSKLDRKGTGRRSYNIVARLNRGDGSTIERDAIAVLSDSQLNALGLSAFLARCQLNGSPFVVLDDPITGSDPEHALTFAGSVLEELLDGGVQVLLLTYDVDLERNACVYHNHRGIDRYHAVLEDPSRGTAIIRTGDEFEEQMAVAQSLMRSPLEDHRRSAGNSLRIAAERLAKQIIVANKRSAGDKAASVGDYDNKNLRDLRDLVKTYTIEANEPGLWDMFSRVLSDADHDVEPPLNGDLVKCHGDLRQLKKTHKDKVPSLMDI
jgi:hypothetical protein